MNREINSSIYKKRLKEPSESFLVPKDCDISTEYGFQIINLSKRKKQAYFFKNEQFNKELKRKYNLEDGQFEMIKQGYEDFSKLFKTKKSLKKYIRRVRSKQMFKDKNV